MKFSTTTVLVTLVLSSAVLATAADAGGKPGGGNGASMGSPGHQMQNATTTTNSREHGASEDAPGDLKRDTSTLTLPDTVSGNSAEPGASGYAPGDAISKAKK